MRAALITAFALFATIACAEAAFPGLNPTSAGFTGMVVSIADGKYDALSPNPDVPNCFDAVCDPNYFVTQIAGWTAQEVDLRFAQAKAFFLERFGLDVDVLEGNGSIALVNLYADPRLNYRTRFIATEHVHEFGWEMHDWGLIVIALEDLPLGGEFAGEVVPPGTLMSFGEYWIQKSRLDRRGDTPRIVSLDEYLVVRYRAASPIPPANVSGRVAAVCEVYESPWGTGVAQVMSAPVFTGEAGLAVYNIRNVMTFDGGDGTGTYPGVYNE